MMMRIIIIFLIFIGLFSCKNEQECYTEYGKSFLAEVGEEYCFPDGSTLLISEFNSDSYCPCNGFCQWPGEGYVVGTWTDPNGSMSTLEIHELLENLNVSWVEMTGISTDDACEPEILSVELRIQKPTSDISCRDIVKINQEAYKNGPKDDVYIFAASIRGDCLAISYWASGCDGKLWETDLYDSGEVMSTNPQKRLIRLSLNNGEDCDAVIVKNQSFDISSLSVENTKLLELQLFEYDGILKYNY